MVKSVRNLELLISHLLKAGIYISVTLTSIGLAMYIIQTGETSIIIRKESALYGSNLFTVLLNLVVETIKMTNPPAILMSLGLLLLMFIQYIRVFAATIYFAINRDIKYVGITLVVLIILTITMIIKI